MTKLDGLYGEPGVSYEAYEKIRLENKRLREVLEQIARYAWEEEPISASEAGAILNELYPNKDTAHD